MDGSRGVVQPKIGAFLTHLRGGREEGREGGSCRLAMELEDSALLCHVS